MFHFSISSMAPSLGLGVLQTCSLMYLRIAGGVGFDLSLACELNSLHLGYLYGWCFCWEIIPHEYFMLLYGSDSQNKEIYSQFKNSFIRRHSRTIRLRYIPFSVYDLEYHKTKKHVPFFSRFTYIPEERCSLFPEGRVCLLLRAPKHGHNFLILGFSSLMCPPYVQVHHDIDPQAQDTRKAM